MNVNVRGPRDLPALRAYLVHAWNRNSAFAYAMEAVEEHHGQLKAFPDMRGAADWEKEVLPRTTLWWVAEEMCDLLAAAEKQLPDETVLERELVPATEGLVVFAKPLTGLDALTTEVIVQVDAIVWGQVRLPPWPGYNETYVSALGISSYRKIVVPDSLDENNWTEEDQQSLLALSGVTDKNWSRLEGELWAPQGRSDWIYGNTVTDRHMDSTAEQQASMAEDRKRVATMWLLQTQEGLADTEMSHGSRAERRRAEREGTDATVRIVNIRRASSSHSSGPAQTHINYRYAVSGHWRKQPYGPKHMYRRPKWIAPHVRGPEGAPFRTSEKVRVWKEQPDGSGAEGG